MAVILLVLTVITTFWSLLSCIQSQSCVIESSLPRAIHSHQTAYDPVSNNMFLFGGAIDNSQDPRSPIAIDTIYRRNMNQTDWNTLNVSTPTSIFTAFGQNSFLVNRIVYFIGMKDASSFDQQSGKIYKFNTVSGNWMSNTQLTPPPYPSVEGCLTGNETHLFMIGGRSCYANCLDEYLQIYNINQNSWVSEAINISPIISNGWYQQYCHVIENDLFVFGGCIGDIDDPIDKIFKYNPLSKWHVLPVTLPKAAGVGVTLFYDPYIYLLGGFSNDLGHALNTIIEFDINTENITNTYAMQEALNRMDAEIVNEKVYIIGGTLHAFEADASTDVEQCNILHTSNPTSKPSEYPTQNPIQYPSNAPSKFPTSPPSQYPTTTPSRYPMQNPSNGSSQYPTASSTNRPTDSITSISSEHYNTSLADTEAVNGFLQDNWVWIVVLCVLLLGICIAIIIKFILILVGTKVNKQEQHMHVAKTIQQNAAAKSKGKTMNVLSTGDVARDNSRSQDSLSSEELYEVHHTNQGVNPQNDVDRMITNVERQEGASGTTDGKTILNVEMILKGSAIMTRGHNMMAEGLGDVADDRNTDSDHDEDNDDSDDLYRVTNTKNRTIQKGE
eukprot:98952_1